ELYRCPDCRAEVSYGDEKCKNDHLLAWDNAAVARIAEQTGTTPKTPTTFLETKIEWGVFGLYILIIAILGVALVYSLSKGTDYTNFSSAIVTALTTIAGFAVGVNSGTPSSPRPSQKK